MTLKNKLISARHTLYRVKAFLIYKTGISKWYRKLVWPFKKEDNSYRAVYRAKNSLFDNHRLTLISDKNLVEIFSKENARWSVQADTVYKAEGIIHIEPKNGLAFFENRALIKETQGHAHKHLTPSFFSYVLYRLGRQKATHFDTVIHFDGFVSKTLYHFFDDALNPLLLLWEKGFITSETPIIIHEKISQLTYVKHFLKLEPFRNFKWYVQKHNEWIVTNNLIKANISTLGWLSLYKYLNISPEKNFRKIFINRREKFQRRLVNNLRIEKILQHHGFTTVFAEDLTYEEQIQLFSNAQFIVALHGAGITNLIYSNINQVHLLETFSRNLVHPHYYWFLELLGIKYYDGIMGTAFDINRNFYVDEDRFEKAVLKMLSYN